ncbi:WD repeat-containing protein 55 homolog [Belonocnema kinseyi]|uniref:WD repeat-containing protein 55 homolog n=1 Tax=Belonocnema kinseyi TaxID=2817044 RepID=UPI00143D082C|nr:WD repeat-containing protein 55 homolog [Belonocnema kinseyi]
MLLNTGILIGSTSKDDSSSSDDDDISISSLSSQDTHMMSENENEDNDSDNDSDSNSDIVLNEEDEDDEVVKAIIKSKEKHRHHPPTINLEDTAMDICFHPNRDLIALAMISGDVLLYKYNNEETELLSTIEMHVKSCRDVEFSADGSTLFSTAKDKSIMLMDVESEKLTRLYDEAHECPIFTLTIINENTFATGDDDGVVKLWDLRQPGTQPIFSLKEMEEYVSAMVTNSDGKYLVCASGDGSLTTINIPGKKMHVQSEEYDEEMTCLGLFKSETKILSATNKGKMYLFNWGEFGLHSDELPSLTKKSINCMIPITENVVVTGGEDGILRATNLFPNRHLGVVGQHNFPVERLDISNDGTLIASSSYENDVKFWNVQYFEDLDASFKIKGGKQKQVKHHLPSSKFNNASDFFADL